MKKLLIIKKLQDENVMYIIIEKKIKNSSHPDMKMFIIQNKDKIRELCTYLFLTKFIQQHNTVFYNKLIPKYTENPTEKDIIDVLGVFSISLSLYKQISNEEILTILFYQHYIKFISKELVEKYGKDLSNFHNYHQLYLFLNEHGYVNKFFNELGPTILSMGQMYIQFIQSHPLFDQFGKKYERKAKYLKNLSIEYLINNYLPQNINKEYILSEYQSYS